MSPVEFQTWVQGVGELFQEQLGSNVEAITVTEGNKVQVKGMIQQLSRDLGEAATLSEAKLRQELKRNKVVFKNGTIDSHRSSAWSAFESQNVK